MKKILKALILASVLVSPMAVAETGYGGLSLGRVDIDDIATGNLGIVLGGIADNGIGYELFYSFTVIDYDESGATYDSAETDSISLNVVYQTPGDLYFKAKGGYSFVNITLDSPTIGRLSDSTDGFSFGVAGGMAIGDGALELSYYRLPEFDDFDGVSFNEDVDMINLAYLWTF